MRYPQIVILLFGILAGCSDSPGTRLTLELDVIEVNCVREESEIAECNRAVDAFLAQPSSWSHDRVAAKPFTLVSTKYLITPSVPFDLFVTLGQSSLSTTFLAEPLRGGLWELSGQAAYTEPMRQLADSWSGLVVEPDGTKVLLDSEVRETRILTSKGSQKAKHISAILVGIRLVHP